MNIKLRLYIRRKKKNFIRNWYKAMKPLANYLTKREERKHDRIEERVTEDQAIKWVADRIIDRVIRYPRHSFRLFIATWKNDDYHSDTYCMGNYSFRRLLKKDKHLIGFDKFNNGIEFQEKVVKYLKSKKGISVTERVEEFTYSKPENYKKTYIIKLEK